MNIECFKEFPDTAQMWIFPFPDNLDADSSALVDQALSEFCTNWQSHGDPVHGAYVIYKNRFVIVTGEVDGGISGCSKDSLMQVFKQLHIERKLNALDDMLIHYRIDDVIYSVNRPAFEERCRKGDITPDTIVYDCSRQFLGDLRDGKFELRFRDSWHASFFPLCETLA